MAEVTSNATMSNEARKCQQNLAELSQKLMEIATHYELLIDIRIADISRMKFSILLIKGDETVAEISA